jgi:hypothetical protein
MVNLEPHCAREPTPLARLPTSVIAPCEAHALRRPARLCVFPTDYWIQMCGY